LEFLAPNLRDTWFTGGLGELAAVNPSGEWHRINVAAVIHGYGASYSSVNAPSIDPFLRAAGFSAAYTTASVTYDPSDAPVEGLTAVIKKDGKQYKSLGCIVTSWSIVANAGEYPIFNAELAGFAPATSITEVSIGTVVLPSTLPPLFENATLAIGSYTPVVRGFEIAGTNTFATRGDGRGTNAHAGFRVTRRMIEFRPRAEHADITNWNPEGDWLASTKRALDMTIGSTQYNKYSFDADDSRVVAFSREDEDGLSIVTPTYRVFTPSTGNEFRIKFL
jgi:hypothetical protein